MELSSLLAEMTQRKASDLHLVAGVPPVFRVAGTLVAAQMPNLTPEDLESLLQPVLPENKLAEVHQGQDFPLTLRHEAKTFCCHVFRERGRLAVALRVFPDSLPTLGELHLPPIFETLTKARRGLILMTGPTGSGKTTTLVSMLEHINMTRAERIFTVEDPMHYVLSSKLSLVTQRVVGEDVASYERGLLSAMESDPDIILVGELRSPETARLALEIAEKGHLILSQTTAETVADAIARLLAMLGEPQDLARRLLARTMHAVVAQKLLVRADCQGRVAANEILLNTSRVSQMIADGQTQPNLLELAMEASSRLGMQTMDEAVLGLYGEGMISRETAVSHLKDKTRLGDATF